MSRPHKAKRFVIKYVHLDYGKGGETGEHRLHPGSFRPDIVADFVGLTARCLETDNIVRGDGSEEVKFFYNRRGGSNG